MKPASSICYRKVNIFAYENLMEQGMAPWMADIVSKRIASPVTLESCLNPSIAKIGNPSTIPDINAAVERIASAVINQEKVIFCVDHDMDGQASAAVLWSAFVQHFKVDPAKLSIVTSHRLTEGYGITNAVVERILASDATLIISADKGSSDEPRIGRIAAAGKDVIVTDHHEVPANGPPASALACVNPTRTTSGYDPYICGAAVAWLTMALVRTELLNKRYLPDILSMVALIDYVAVATVADCVSLRPDLSYANRAFVMRGLSLINGKTRPCWEVFCDSTKDIKVTAQTIGFQLAPAVAAAGRLDWADSGFKFLIAESKIAANSHWQVLQKENEERKAIEKELRSRAYAQAVKMKTKSLVIYLEDGHSGVHGITASRLVEMFGKPVAIFARKGSGMRDGSDIVFKDDVPVVASGSFRGIPGFHIRDALQLVDDLNPGLLISFGGHAGAAGATIALEDFERFQGAYEVAVSTQLKKELHPELLVDGGLDESLLSLETVDGLEKLEPFGRDFPSPVYLNEFRVVNVKPVGDGSHLKLILELNNQKVDAIWFNAIEAGEGYPVASGGRASFAYQLSDNVYRNKRSLQLMIVALA